MTEYYYYTEWEDEDDYNLKLRHIKITQENASCSQASMADILCAGVTTGCGWTYGTKDQRALA